jgi:AraC-like DNA-binding protein
MLLPVRYLNTLYGDGNPHGLAGNVYHHACHTGHGKRLIARMNRTIDHCLENPDLLENPAQRNALETCLIDDLAEMSASQENELFRMRLSARRRTLRRALEYGESIQQKISVPQFAADLSVNRRSLELAFRDCLGITPRQYLSIRRLHGVHNELRERSPRSHCITEVANSWGFTELGRFAAEYNNLFGELPKATLNRQKAKAPQQFVDLFR